MFTGGVLLTHVSRTLNLAAVALVTGGIAIGIAEFVAMGLLPEMAAGVGVDLPTAGQAISAYAVGVVVGAPVISALGAGMPKRRLLTILMAAFLVANIGTALAPNHGVLLVTRFISGLPHGAFFGLSAVVAVELAAAGQGARAVSRVMLGIPLANVAGVPIATAVGQALGWRAAFVLVAIVAAATLVMIQFLVPAIEGSDQNVRSELRAFRRPQLWLAIAIGAIGFGGQFAMYSYIKPMLLEVSGARIEQIPLVLLVFGVGGIVGTWLGGNIASRSLWATIFISLGALAVSFTLLALLAPILGLAVTLVGVVAAWSAVLAVGMQMRLMEVAGDARTIGASLSHAALNMANALGAYLGGLTLAWGWGFIAPTWTALVLSLCGIAIAVVSYLVARSQRDPRPEAQLA